MPPRIEPLIPRVCSPAEARSPAKNTSRSRRQPERIEPHRGDRVQGDEPRILQPDERDEEPDPDGNPAAQARADRVHHDAAQPGQRHQQEQDARHEDHPSATAPAFVWPAAVAAGIKVSTRKKFAPMPGACAIGARAYRPMITVASAAARQVAVITGTKVEPRLDAEHAPGEHSRLHKDDVGHGQERRCSRSELGADGAASLFELEVALEESRRIDLHRGHTF